MIETKRLRLRPWSEADADDLYRYASDERVSKMALWPTHTSVEMSRDVIRQFFMPHECVFAIELKSTSEVIGCIGLVPEGDEHYAPLPREREVGYWVGRPHWGRGIVPEALVGLIAYCRERGLADSLLLTIDARNAASRRVAEKCAFVEFDRYDCDGIDSVAYRLDISDINRDMSGRHC